MKSVKGLLQKIGKWIAGHKAVCISVVAGILAVALSLTLLLVFKGEVEDPVAIVSEITPTISDSNGVYTTSAFLIEGKAFEDKDQLLSQLSTNIEIPFKVDKTVQGNYLLTFESALAPASICNFFIDDGKGNDRSYAFQTKADFAVRSFFPRENASVPLDTGVEITFTNDSFTDFESYIEIAPKAEYTIEKLANRVVIIPTQAWENDTYYTVTVKKGLSNGVGETIEEDISATFYAYDTDYVADEIHRSGELEETFLTTDIPVIKLATADNVWAENRIDYANLKFDLTVYRVPSSEEYANLLRTKEERDGHVFSFYGQYVEYRQMSTSGMEQALKCEVGIIPYQMNDYSTAYIVFPQELEEGYYLASAECTLNGKTYVVQKLIQINDTVVYLRSGHGEVFAWINDAKTATALPNATVTVDGGGSVKTDSNGIATVKVESVSGAAVVTVGVEGRKPFVASMQVAPQEELPPSEVYYSYIYTDRESYLPTDTVRVYGTLSPRYGARLPDSVTVAIGYVSYDYDYNAERSKVRINPENTLYKAEVKPDKHGAFNAEIPISALQYGYYDICIAIDGRVVSMKGIRVEDYVKPAFTVKFDELKEYYAIGDNVKFGMTAEYYGGIPAAGEEFEINGGYYITDSNGRIELDYAVSPDYIGTDWRPNYAYISVTDNLTLDKVNSFYTNYYYLPKDVMLNADTVKGSDGKLTLKVNTNLIDVDKANSTEERDYDKYDYLKGAPYDTAVRVYIESYTYAPPTEYTYYDYVAKKAVTTLVYSSDVMRGFISDTEYQTVNGELSVDLELPELERGYYRITLSHYDTQGRFTSNMLYCGDDDYYIGNTSSIKYYTLSDDNEPNYNGNYGYKYIDSKKIDEAVPLKLVDECGNFIEDGSIMLGIVNSAINENRLYKTTSLELTFREEYVPNVYLVGAYFDGKRVFELSKSFIEYDYSEKELDVSISTDKEEYLPGEEMKITVSVKDKNGNPQEGSVNVSVVDEAQFAVAPQYVNTLTALYGSNLGTGCEDIFVSYTQHSFNGDYVTGGEGGGGDGEGISRQDFLDTAAFETLRTNKNGIAEVTVKLPDNVTDWRITVNAVSDKLHGGNGKKNVSAALDFVVDAVIGNVFQAKDDFSFGIHAYGSALREDTAVEYTAILKKADGTETSLSKSVRGREFCYLNFGRLSEGEYSVTVKGASSVGNDAIERKFTVISSADELNIVSEFKLADGIDINALRSPVTLMLSNGNAKYVASALYGEYYSSGARMDMQIASAAAGKLLEKYAAQEDKIYYTTEQTEIGAWQGSGGGVAIYPYAEEDAFITSFGLWADAESFNRDAVRRYFNNTEEIEKYVGLAAMGEPVLLDIYALLAETEADDIYTRMLLTCALTAIGDDSGAEDEFEATFRALIREEGFGAWIESGDDAMNEKLTAMALCVASRTDRELAVKLMRYLNDRQLKDYYGLQKVIYARNMLYGAYGEAEFEYTDSEGTHKVTLTGVQTKTFRMTVEALEAADFKATKGEVSVMASYVGGWSNLDTQLSELKVEKTVSTVDGSEMTVGSKVEVIIEIPRTADGDFISVSDYIPSGFRFSEFDYSRSENAWLCSQNGQRVSINANVSKESAYAVFYIRPITEGTFVLNSAFVSNDDGDWGMTPEVTVTVK